MGDDKNARSGILDVARVAGVSPATVSRVINGTAKVSPATRQAVQAAIKTLHYEPNKFARSLITNRSGIIGVLIDRSIRYATANVLVQLEEYASLRGYMSVVLTVDKPFRERFMQALTKFRSLSAEGIIVIAPRIELSETIVDCNVPEPVIIVSSELSDIGIPMVGENQYDGACRAIRHLAQSGHREIWHVAGSQDWFDERRRMQGWQDTLRQQELGPGRMLQASWSPKSAYDIVMDTDFSHMPDAIFVASDHMAMAVISALVRKGLRVPEDISIVSFDDAEGAAYATPPLTTVKQNLPAVARKAVSLLVDVIEGRSVSAVTVMDSKLVVRSSTRSRITTH